MTADDGRPSAPDPRGGPDARDRPARLTVGVVGAGRAGAPLGAALARAGHSVVAASGVSARSRRRAEQLLPGVPLRPADEVAGAADLVLLTVPDDALPGLAEGLAATGAVRAGTLVVHTSGARGLAVLEPLTRAGALPLALHPVLSFTGTEVDLHRLAGVCWGVTAPEPLRPVAEVLVLEMSGEPVWVADDRRPLWHAALAVAANHLTTLVNEAADLLAAAGAETPARVLGPLLSAALDNALRSGDAALTGPVARGDAGTVRAHLAALQATSTPAGVAAYIAMARLTAERAMEAGRLAPEHAEALLDVLGGTR